MRAFNGSKGYIDRIEPTEESENKMGERRRMGTFEDGRTFDLPIDQLSHQIGDEIKFSDTDPDEQDKVGEDVVIFIMESHNTTAIWADETERGMEIQHMETFRRTH